MIFKHSPMLSVLLSNVLAAVATSSATLPAEGLIKHIGIVDGGDVWFWKIGQNEQNRLTDMLHHNFYDINVEGTYLNAPPQICSHCGKETEFIDWVYTALNRGVHSPEFLVESLTNGRIPKGLAHDVYCSHCGHLTAFRNEAGEEGGAFHISNSTAYDRATRTFAHSALHVNNPSEADGYLWIPSQPWFAKRPESELSAPNLATTENKGEGYLWIPSDPWFTKRAPQVAQEAESTAKTGKGYLWIPSQPWFAKRAPEALSDQESTAKRGFIWIPSQPWFGKRGHAEIQPNDQAK